ncbi:MAG: DUF6807 family protein [Akkermansiaceae bacterium]
MKHFLIILLLPFLLLPCVGAAELSFKDTEGKHLDVLFDGKVLTRYMYEHDTSTPERHKETYKPYLHVFDEEGQAPITKGAGGKFPHHRGIFVGWNRIGFNGKTYDRWHMKGGDIVHQKFTEQKIHGGKVANFTSLVHWMDEKGEPFLEEKRNFAVMPMKRGDETVSFIIVASDLTAIKGDVSLKGDPEHAGVQFRPADHVEKKKTKYLFPDGVTDVKKSKDIGWAAESFVLDGKKYGVVHLNHPENPKGTVYSAYRDYGRFGAFFETDIPKGETLKFAYGFLIKTGNLPERAKIAQFAKRFPTMLSPKK